MVFYKTTRAAGAEGTMTPNVPSAPRTFSHQLIPSPASLLLPPWLLPPHHVPSPSSDSRLLNLEHPRVPVLAHAQLGRAQSCWIQSAQLFPGLRDTRSSAMSPRQAFFENKIILNPGQEAVALCTLKQPPFLHYVLFYFLL